MHQVCIERKSDDVGCYEASSLNQLSNLSNYNTLVSSVTQSSIVAKLFLPTSSGFLLIEASGSDIFFKRARLNVREGVTDKNNDKKRSIQEHFPGILVSLIAEDLC